MVDALWVVGIALWIAWAAQAVLSAMLVRKFARAFDRPPREAHQLYRPPAALIVPFKGAEPGLAEHLGRLLTQDYPDYRVLCVVESEEDPACPIVRDTLARHDRPSELIVAGEANNHEGQKVHNLLAALDQLQREGMPVEVVVFADSDAAPDAQWMGRLIGPLIFPNCGVSTGYRWMIPQPRGGAGASQGPTLASRFASVINSSVACWAGRDRYNHAWGGSMALRVDTIREGDLVGRWRGALSDDYQVSRMCKDLGKRIYFVHRCLVAAPVDFTWRSLFEFGRRQYLITRAHAPRLYLGALVLTTLYLAGAAWTATATIWLALRDWRDPIWLAPLAAIVVSTIADAVRVRARRHAIRSAFGDDTARQLQSTLRIDRDLVPITMAIHWLIVLAALVGRTITWRGKRYRIDAPQRIARLPSRSPS